MQIGILEPKMFSSSAISLLKKIGNVSCYNGSNLKQFLSPLNILFVRLSYNIDKSFLTNCPNLQWICSPTTGHNHLDIDCLKVNNINIITLKDEKCFLKSIRAPPEHTFGLILSVLRRYSIAFTDISNGIWDRDKCRGEELSGNKIGIIGLGRVGHQVAKYCDAFGAEIMWHDNCEVISNPNWIKLDSVLDVIKSSRVIILCADYKKNQKPIIGKIEIKNLHERYFINTSRGELVDEEALIETVQRGKLAGVALDVITNENSLNKLSIWQELTLTQNVIITPHIGGITKESLKKTEIYIAEKLKLALT
jgi:D-3-phosphoglycerate dehydrogenase